MISIFKTIRNVIIIIISLYLLIGIASLILDLYTDKYGDIVIKSYQCENLSYELKYPDKTGVYSEFRNKKTGQDLGIGIRESYTNFDFDLRTTKLDYDDANQIEVKEMLDCLKKQNNVNIEIITKSEFKVDNNNPPYGQFLKESCWLSNPRNSKDYPMCNF
jgi:hypothetical protein